MHANQILEECDKCNAKFYSKDLKFQHCVFQCICNATSGLTEVLKEPFKRIILPKSFMKSFPINLQDNDKILVRKPKRAVKEKDSLSEMDLQPYQCDICGQFLKNKRNLEGHIKNVHLNIKSIACQYCGETFKSHANRRYHLKNVHNKEFEHICSVCGKAFFTPSFLKYHEASHFENYTIPCTVPNCTKLCKTKIHLQKHIAHRHSNKTFTCDLCGKLFTNKANLRQHKTTHKPNTYFCPECPNTFSASHAMRKHVAEKHPTFEMPPVGTLIY
uniref:CSON002293 protein n=1 Tax=Culicoides sonorensis TaxID=179676 RepID=A0A336MWF2_CULSO